MEKNHGIDQKYLLIDIRKILYIKLLCLQKKILVTGVAGFLGSHLSEKLVDLGHQVIGIDNMLGGYEDNVPKKIDFIILIVVI